uniref:Putative secreted protein n=1 Tax=Anopheles triannulatus TaxID=58253 RepID=A0A2M4B4B9_9DIPT
MKHPVPVGASGLWWSIRLAWLRSVVAVDHRLPVSAAMVDGAIDDAVMLPLGSWIPRAERYRCSTRFRLTLRANRR